MADEASRSVVYVQGGESVISNGTDGMYELTVDDVVPYTNVAIGAKNHLEPVQLLSVFTYPLYAALVFSDAEGEISSLLKITNVTISKDNKTLTLKVTPFKYYEGEMLKSFANGNNGINTIKEGIHNETAIYLEMNQKPLENGCSYPCPIGCFWSTTDNTCWWYSPDETFEHCPLC